MAGLLWVDFLCRLMVMLMRPLWQIISECLLIVVLFKTVLHVSRSSRKPNTYSVAFRTGKAKQHRISWRNTHLPNLDGPFYSTKYACDASHGDHALRIEAARQMPHRISNEKVKHWIRIRSDCMRVCVCFFCSSCAHQTIKLRLPAAANSSIVGKSIVNERSATNSHRQHDAQC